MLAIAIRVLPFLVQEQIWSSPGKEEAESTLLELCTVGTSRIKLKSWGENANELGTLLTPAKIAQT